MYRIVNVAAGLSIAFCLAGPALAAKVGSEFLVSGKALNSSVAPLPGGGFVVVWRGPEPNYPILGQRYDNSAVKVGPQIRVVAAAPELVVPSVAAVNGGGFVVTWAAPDASGLGAWVQRFDSGGVKLGGKVLANRSTADDQLAPTAAGLKNGTFVVTWMSNHPNPEGDSNIFAQRFSAAGAKLGGEIRVDTTFAIQFAFHEFPSVAALTSGGFVIVYRGYNGTYARRFNASGGALGNDFQVNLVNEGLSQHPVVAGLKDGGFVVAREVSGADTDIYGQRFDAAGGRAGSDFRVNTATTGAQLDPAVAALSNGGFVITYSEYSAHLCMGRLYNAAGAAVGASFKANTADIAIDARSTVAPQLAGAFVTTYQSIAPSGVFVVRGQRFNGH